MLESQYEHSDVIATETLSFTNPSTLILIFYVCIEDTSQDKESSEASGHKEEDESGGWLLEIT